MYTPGIEELRNAYIKVETERDGLRRRPLSDYGAEFDRAMEDIREEAFYDGYNHGKSDG